MLLCVGDHVFFPALPPTAPSLTAELHRPVDTLRDFAGLVRNVNFMVGAAAASPCPRFCHVLRKNCALGLSLALVLALGLVLSVGDQGRKNRGRKTLPSPSLCCTRLPYISCC